MGWSHSVDVAQCLHEHVLRSYSSLSPSAALLDGTSSYCYADRLLYSSYIDDTVLLHIDPLVLQRAIDDLAVAYQTAGVTVKWSKLVQPSCDGVDVLGLELHGRHATYGLSPVKMHQLILSTRSFLTRTHCTGRDLARIVGSWTWAALVRRECLCVFRAVYRFCAVAGDRIFHIWPSVRQELWTMMGLAPLMYADLSATWCDRVIATDACTTGHGASTSLATAEAMSVLARCQPVPSIDTPEETCAFTAMSMGIRTWKHIVSAPFYYHQHINTLELNAVLVALRWLLSFRASVNKRVLMLGDSQVVVHALSKGRTSAPTLFLPLRRLSCFVLASGLRVSYRWIPSEFNPADGPSRAFTAAQ